MIVDFRNLNFRIFEIFNLVFNFYLIYNKRLFDDVEFNSLNKSIIYNNKRRENNNCDYNKE